MSAVTLDQWVADIRHEAGIPDTRYDRIICDDLDLRARMRGMSTDQLLCLPEHNRADITIDSAMRLFCLDREVAS